MIKKLIDGAFAVFSDTTEPVVENQLKTSLFEVRSVTDGDTIAVTALWAPDKLAKMSIRIRGMDTPEEGYRAKCPLEAELGVRASARLQELLEGAEGIEFLNLGWDKYGGRILADVFVDGQSVVEVMIAEGLARPYFGDAKSDWCNV